MIRFAWPQIVASAAGQLWMIVNVVAVGVYWVKDLRLTAGLYVIFFVMAVAGDRAWRRSLRGKSAIRTACLQS